MKKVILILLMGLISLSGFGQLSGTATLMKKSAPEYYEAVEASAAKKWGSDHQMRLYEINKQSKAFFKMVKEYNSVEGDPERVQIMRNAYSKWHVKGNTVDWSMVMYEYEKQLKAFETLEL